MSDGTPAAFGSSDVPDAAHVTTSLVRPDGRLLVRPANEWTATAAAAAVQFADRRALEAITHVDESAAGERSMLAAAGFVESRLDAHVAFSVEPALDALGAADVPPDVRLLSAAEVDEGRLRLLDDELRQDVPGTSGWSSTPEEFRDHTFADPAFDPRTYLVAVDATSGELVGLVRIWMNPEGPRLGLVAVRREQRRRGIARALLAHALRAVRATAATEVTAEYDLTNDASRAIAERLGARRVGTHVELAYQPRGEASRVA